METSIAGGLNHYQPVRTGAAASSGWTVYHAETTASTNADCRMFADSDGAERVVFCAGQQSGGRGRRGRDWTSPPGNLYASMLLRPTKPLSEALTLGFVAGVALVDTLKLFAPALDAMVKWPNDVLVDHRKVAGILLESSASGTICDYVVIGVGLNLASAPSGSGSDFRRGGYEPGSLSEWMIPPPADVFLGAFLPALDASYDEWRNLGFGPIRRRWEACATGIGSDVSVVKAGQRITGVFAGLDESGAMLIDAVPVDAGAGQVRVTVGDVAFRGAGTDREPECS